MQSHDTYDSDQEPDTKHQHDEQLLARVEAHLPQLHDREPKNDDVQDDGADSTSRRQKMSCRHHRQAQLTKTRRAGGEGRNDPCARHPIYALIGFLAEFLFTEEAGLTTSMTPECIGTQQRGRM